jgi:hypothetical protein
MKPLDYQEPQAKHSSSSGAPFRRRGQALGCYFSVSAEAGLSFSLNFFFRLPCSSS